MHKTTILRWVVGLALALWPIIAQGIVERIKAQMVYVDEKWLKVRGRWHYWFIVLDVTTELPVLAALLPSWRQWACRWLGWQLRHLKKVPHVIITDGLQAYAYLVPGAKHVLCRFHHQQGVTQWLQQHFATANAIERFFRAFQRFYATRGGFHSVLSAKRELLLFLVVHVFTQRATDGQAPIEVMMPEARRMPLYRLINAPFRALQEQHHVKAIATMADLLVGKAAAA
jgi:transposase-like protein